MEEGTWRIIEPVMLVEVTSPVEFQGEIMSSITKRNGVILGSEQFDGFATIQSKVTLMFCNSFP